MFKGFKEFAMRGNVVDLAIALSSAPPEKAPLAEADAIELARQRSSL
jgi:hypothetical protein